MLIVPRWLPWCSDGKVCACNADNPGSILGQKDSLEKEMAVSIRKCFLLITTALSA